MSNAPSEPTLFKKHLQAISSLQPHSLWWRYAIALGLILVLVLTSHALSHRSLASADADANLINMSGRQRMLSQQITHHAHMYAALQTPDRRAALLHSVETFERSNETLAAKAAQKPKLEKLYFEEPVAVDAMSRNFVKQARLVLESPESSENALAYLDKVGTGVLLRNLDTAVAGFESVAHDNAALLRAIMNATLVATILTLVGEGLLIFWPAHRSITTSFNALKREVALKQAAIKRLSHFASIASDLFWETDREPRLVYADGRFLERSNRKKQDIVGRSFKDVIKFDDDQLLQLGKALKNLEPYEGVIGEVIDGGGKPRKVEVAGMPRFDDDGEFVGYLGTADDITEEFVEKETIKQMALTDELTGLANKRGFDTALRGAMRLRRNTQGLYLMALDLDGFKAVNDTHGHDAGDEVLQIVANRIRHMLRETDAAARVGGDEYFVLMKDAESAEAAYALAERLIQTLSRPYKLSNATVAVSASIGIAGAPTDAGTPAALRKAADEALYAAKHGGKNQYRFYADLGEDKKSA